MSGWDLPAPEGAELLDDIRAAITRYCVLPSDEAITAVVLWVAATHCLTAFDFATRLVIRSAEKRSGKTRLMEIVAELSHEPLRAMNATVPAIFRSLDAERPPTVLIDEADTIFGSRKVAEQNEDLRGLLNAGFQRGTPVLRTVGPQHVPTKFPVFAMTALAGIGRMPDTIEDRAVVVVMQRRKPSEPVSPYRIGRDRIWLHELAARLSAWAADVVGGLAEVVPAMPVEDRAADTWESLVAVADAAGGTWPEDARRACVRMTNEAAEADEDESVNLKLLADIANIFAALDQGFIGSQSLVDQLHKAEESPWSDWDLTTNALSRRLREYKIRPRRNTAGNERGYRVVDFRDAFERYLRQNPSEPSETLEPQAKASDTSKSSDTFNRQTVSEPSADNPWNLSDSDASDAFGHLAGRRTSQPVGSDIPGRCSCGFDVATMGHRDGCREVAAS